MTGHNDPDVLAGPVPYQLAILLGLTRRGKHVYAGTVASAVKARRRAANKVARRQRKANRRSA